MKKLIILVLLISSGYGCKKENLKDTDLLKTKWTLNYIQNTQTNEIMHYPDDASRKISIVFTDSLNILSFSGVCNGGAGKYSYSSSTGEIKITDLRTTLIDCKYAEWEGYTAQNLESAIRYKINGNSLVIYSNGKYNLYFTNN